MTALRGIANNNPANLRRSDIKWQGMSDSQTDPDFMQFKSAEYGIRAACRLLLTYKSRGLNTVFKIISAWAPPSENETTAYIADVAARCEVGPNDELDVDNADICRALVKAIITHENGRCPYADSVIDDAMRLAGIHDVAPKPMPSRSITIAGAGTAVAAASETVRQLSDVRDTVDTGADLLQWALHLGPWLALALVLIGLCGLGYGLWTQHQRLGI